MPEDSTIGNPLFTLVKIDIRAQRVFVVIDSNTVEDLGRIRNFIEQVSKSSGFKTDLNISFFTTRNYAGYKDEFEDRKGMVSQDYFSSYVGEYDKQTESYWTYPTSQIKKKKYSFK